MRYNSIKIHSALRSTTSKHVLIKPLYLNTQTSITLLLNCSFQKVANSSFLFGKCMIVVYMEVVLSGQVSEQQIKVIQKIFKMRRHPQDNPIGHLTNPIVTGGAVIALRCKEGVIIATDTLLSYGGLLKYHGVNRYQKIADNVIVTATGEFADFQEATRKLKDLAHESAVFDDGVTHSVQEYSNYLAALAYDRRNNQNPFYNNFVIAGYEHGKAYLSSVDLYGTHIHKDYITAGFSKYYGLALIANQWNPTKTLQQCKRIIHRCFTIIYERDCHSIDEVQFATVTEQGVEVLAPEKVQSDWDFNEFRERKNEKLWQ